MAKQQPSTDMVRFQLSQFPDLKPLADRVGADGEGRGGLVREVRRLVRLGMALESIGIGPREIQALMDGALQLVPAGTRTAAFPHQPFAPMNAGAVAPAIRSAHSVAAVQHDDPPIREATPHRGASVGVPSLPPAAERVAVTPDRSPPPAIPEVDPVLEAFIV